jgi:DNA-directed RNA polymerase specialized sigma24 family protein
MPVPVRRYFSEAVLIEIPHLWAYARMMTNDVSCADREVEETLKRATSIMDRMSKRSDLLPQLLMILRSFLIGSEQRHRYDFTTQSAMYEKLNSPFRIGNGHSKIPLGLASALVCLDYEDREAVVLSMGLRLSHREAAKISGCEFGVYNRRLARGLARLAELIPGLFAGNTADEVAASDDYPVLKEAAMSMEVTPPNQPQLTLIL